MQSDGYHNDADIVKVLGTMGGKVNDVQRQFDLTNIIDSNLKKLKTVTLLTVTMLLMNV